MNELKTIQKGGAAYAVKVNVDSALKQMTKAEYIEHAGKQADEIAEILEKQGIRFSTSKAKDEVVLSIYHSPDETFDLGKYPYIIDIMRVASGNDDTDAETIIENANSLMSITKEGMDPVILSSLSEEGASIMSARFESDNDKSYKVFGYNVNLRPYYKEKSY